MQGRREILETQAVIVTLLYTAATVTAILNPRIASTTAEMVTLLCNMRDFIRPDEQFQWFRDTTLISDELSDRYSVVYVDGSLGAQNGLDTLSPTRLSGLIISQPVPSDAGIYSCQVNGTPQFDVVELIVDDPNGEFTWEGYATASDISHKGYSSVNGIQDIKILN